MIDCENCILKSALESDTGRCCVNCLDLEDALREHDKQIRAEVFDKCIEEIIPTLYELDVEQSVIDIVKRWFEHLKENK